MFFVRHLYVVLGIASASVRKEKLAVAAAENVDIGVRELGIMLRVNGTVLRADVSRHERSSMGGVLAVEDDQGSTVHGSVKQVGSEKLLIIVVYSSVNMATLVLVLKSAVDDELLVILATVLAIKNVDQSILGDSWYTVTRIIGREVREKRLLRFLDVHDCLERLRKRGSCGFGIGLHDILRMLKHAKRPTDGLARPEERV